MKPIVKNILCIAADVVVLGGLGFVAGFYTEKHRLTPKGVPIPVVSYDAKGHTYHGKIYRGDPNIVVPNPMNPSIRWEKGFPRFGG